MDVRKKFFKDRAEQAAREVVDAPSLEVLKTRLDGALGNLL